MDNLKSKQSNQPSVIRGLFEYAKQRKKEIGEDKVFDFTLGNPNIATPEEVNKELVNLIQTMDPVLLHGYTPNSGVPEVKKAIKDYLEKTYHAQLDENLIYITAGASPAIVFTIHALLHDGGEAIIFAPYFPEYTHYMHYIGAKYSVVKPDQNLLPDFEDLQNKINSMTRLVIYNSPNNPSGAFYNEETIIKLCRILKEKEKEFGHPIYLLSDEPYREILFDNHEYPFITNYYDDSIVSYSYSKSLSLAGERIGYLLVNPKAQDSEGVYSRIINAGHNLGYVSTPSLFQYLLPRVLGKTSNLDFYRENRDLLCKVIKETGFEVFYPHGAFYMLIKAPDGDSIRFSDVGKRFEIIMVPCDEFGLPGYVRLAYCVKRNTIIDSKESFEKLYRYYEGDKDE